MVLESLAGLRNTEKHPILLFFISFTLSLAGVLMAYYTFPTSSSVLAISFASFAMMPIIHNLFAKEEEGIALDQSALNLFSENFEVIHIYTWMFLGILASYVVMGSIFPDTHEGCSGLACQLPEKKLVFSEQLKVYGGITGRVTEILGGNPAPAGDAGGGITGNAVGSAECFDKTTKKFDACFELIFRNNMWVMVLSVLFSLIWGAGALFLLGWNASVIGLFISAEITAKSLGAGITRAVSYLPHGIPEVVAYFIGAIAGGIISAAIAKTKFRPHEIRTVIIDAALLMLLATVTLALAGVIEAAAIFGYSELAIGALLGFAIIYTCIYVPSIRHSIERVRTKTVKLGF